MPPVDPSDLFAHTDSPAPGQTDPAPVLVERTSSPSDPPAEGGVFADDFLLLRELGRGAFARVFLARQRSLGRPVALKLTDRPGAGEGPLLAALEHDHIVKVFAGVRDPSTRWHGLVLQYIPGTHLGRVLADVFRDGRRPATGRDVLDAIDRQAADPVPFDPSALADREEYRRGAYPEVVCRLAAKLADALAFAHARHVLHCDIKPANILLDRYGRPLLADFNVAVPLPDGDGPITPIGGTLPYMSPEHLAAFGRIDGQPPVDRRSDLYALGLVVLEAVSGRPPPSGDPRASGPAHVLSLWCERQSSPDDWLRQQKLLVPLPVWRVLRRCLAAAPAERYQTADELAAALRGAADQLGREAVVPPGGRLARATRLFPLRVLFLFVFLPHLIGSAVNIGYNRAAVRLLADEVERFAVVTAAYNLIVYPVCVAATVAMLLPIVKYLRSDRPDRTPADELDRLRRRALRLGRWGAALAAVGWFPGGVIFPLALTDWSAGFDWPRFGHLLVSFAVSGLIALTYSYLGIQYVVVRGLYPRLMHPEQTPDERRAEAERLHRELGWVPFAAAAVPLVGAVVQTAFAPAAFTFEFRLLITGLIVTGMIGLAVAVGVTQHLRRLTGLLTGRSL